MIKPVQPLAKPEIVYPESDGQPMADNTEQFHWIVTIQGGLDALFRDDINVFVAGDLLWYPVEGDNKIRQAPDVMVVRFELSNGELELYRPDGQKFVSYVELDRQREREQQEKEVAQAKAEKLAERLCSLGIDSEQV